MSATRDPAALSDTKRALLERRMRGRDAATADFPRRPASAPVLLSPGQQRLWFLHQLAPASGAYTMFDARRLAGPIDPERLRDCIAGVVRRHQILRTRYETRDGLPAPIVEPGAAFGFETGAFDDVPPAAREALAREHATRFIRRPFDLETGPVLRACLLRVGADDHVLAIAVHHIACDEWSLDVIWRELAKRYVEGPQRADETSPLQYADYAHWQIAQRTSPAMERHLAHWRAALRGCPPALDLPADRTPPAQRSFRGGIVADRVEGDVAERTAALARSAGTTRFVLQLAAFLVLLHRYTGETDLVVGVPATGRSHPALESVVGFFLNTLALRVDVSGDPTFRELLRRVNTVFLDGVTHADAPFEAVVDAVAPDRRLSRNPLFSTMFVERTEPAPVSFGDDVTVGRFPLDGGGSKFDITLFAGGRDGGLETMLEYDSDRFDAATAGRMLEHFRALLAELAADADRPISTLPLASPAERRRIEVSSHGPALPAVQPVHDLFAARARHTPDRVAVIADGESVGYGQLHERARAVARRLQAAGVARSERVALCADRSAAMIAGIFGILEAGAAYVPLDPAYPRARIDFAIRDAGARFVLAAGEHASRFIGSDATVVPLDGGATSPDGMGDVSAIRAGLDDAAYVLHTSGSTGVPKAVLVSHRNLASSTAARDVAYGEPPAVFMLLPSFAFDSSVAGIFWTLTSGAALALPPRRIEQDVHALAAFIAGHGVTHTLCLPSLWQTILEHAPIAALRGLRTVIVAGETCPTRLVRRHYGMLPDVALWNEYGPTEATVWSTAYAIPRAFDGARVPIGGPVAGARAYVVEASGEPAPIGVPGELWVGGAGVALYLHPDGGSPRFVADPFPAEPGARLYRTGDRVRWRDDGVLEFLGRIDQQVKVRGYRIEPAEIESALQQHAGVRDVAVGTRTVRGNAASEAGAVDRLTEVLDALPHEVAERLLRLVESTPAVEAAS